MDLTSRVNIKNLLKKYGVSPSKRLGQNFLIDKSVLKKIVEAAELKSDDAVLEIGPGLGVLTQELAGRVKGVIAVEKDQKMIEILRETLKDFKNIEIIRNDILKIENWKLIENLKLGVGNSYKVVANLPYYLVSPVVRHFLENTPVQPVYMTLMVQKEVAQRITAKPPRMNLLAVSVQFYAEPKIIFYVPKSFFWPQPKVNGAVIKITPKPDPAENKDLFFKILKAGFSQPRKQLANNLSRAFRLRSLSFGGQEKYDKKKVAEWLLANGIRPSQRAETLSVEDWVRLTKNLTKQTD